MQDYISPEDIAYSFLIFNYKEKLESFFLSKTVSNVCVRDVNVLIFLDFSFRYDSVH